MPGALGRRSARIQDKPVHCLTGFVRFLPIHFAAVKTDRRRPGPAGGGRGGLERDVAGWGRSGRVRAGCGGSGPVVEESVWKDRGRSVGPVQSSQEDFRAPDSRC